MIRTAMAHRIAPPEVPSAAPPAPPAKAGRKVADRVLIEKARALRRIAMTHADSVDTGARFPKEVFDALRRERLLGIMIPRALGGPEASLTVVAEVCSLLAQGCSASGMIYAMHQIKVSSLVTHAQESRWHRAFMERIADEQLLLGSATTEGGGIGGDMRSSHCGVEQRGSAFQLRKEGCVISYGLEADSILITARRTPESPPSDQVMAVMTRDQYTLERMQVWNTLGMRGTCSDSFTFEGAAPVEQIIPAPFADIAAQSMLAHAHILWAATWYGIAADAVGRAEAFVRAEARRQPGVTPPGALRLAELLTLLQRMKALIIAGIERYENAKTDPDELSAIGFVVAMNAIKVSASQGLCEIIQHAFLICGIHGYRNDSPYSLGRHLRDSMSTPLMINNDRILGNTANLLPAYRHDPSLIRWHHPVAKTEAHNSVEF
jgi:acyl-CoA dehydrogenase